MTPEIPLSELQKFVGRYGDGSANEFTILIRNQRLAVQLPNNTSFDLRPPDAAGRRATRANLGIGVTFEESPAGVVSSMTLLRPGATPPLRLTPVTSALPTVAEIMTLRRITPSAPATMRITGTVRIPASAVEGRFSTSSAGDDQLRSEMDIDGAIQIRTVLNKGRASASVSGASARELTGKQLAQTRLSHPSVIFGDWRKYYDAIRVIRVGEFSGRKVYGIQLESAGLPPTLVAVDAETGDVLQTRAGDRGSGEAGAIPTTTTYSDYRDVNGMRVPHRYVRPTRFPDARSSRWSASRLASHCRPTPSRSSLHQLVREMRRLARHRTARARRRARSDTADNTLLERPFLPRASNVEQDLQNDVDFQQARSSSQ